jgi:hypothetical protein
MDQIKDRINLQGEYLASIRRVINADGKISDAEIARRSWHVYSIDDKSIFDEDARRLENAFRTQNSNLFYVVRVKDLLAAENFVIAYQFKTTISGIERFQGSSYYEINLDDCLLFNLPVTCAVLRPGSVDTTIFVGDNMFIGKMEI